jgi:ribosomal protein S27E
MKITVICFNCGNKQVVTDDDDNIKCKSCGHDKFQMVNSFKKEAELNLKGYYK